MKKLIILLVALSMFGCAGMQTNDEVTEFAVESLAMAIGYEMRGDFKWSSTTDAYYAWIMDGKVNLEGAKIAEGYLREVTHPVIANRMVRLAAMAGFDLDDMGGIVGVGNVDTQLLQAAATGFKVGLLLE